MGDLWCAFPQHSGLDAHPDVADLEIDMGTQDVYGYDMYISPKERGNSSIASVLFKGALYDLKRKGFKLLHCYVYADKIPAIWLHRMLGFKEVYRGVSQRLLFYKKLEPIKTSASKAGVILTP